MRLWVLSVAIVSALAGCGGPTGEGNDGGDGDAGAPRDGGAPDDGGPRTDAGPIADGGPGADTGPADAGPMADADPGADGGPVVLCTCDTTLLCETGCACDYACAIVVDPSPPIGGRIEMLQRNEAFLYRTSSGVPGTALDAYDDGISSPFSPTPYFHTFGGAAHSAIADTTRIASGDLDGDGHDELVYVSTTAVSHDKWLAPGTSAPSLVPTADITYPTAATQVAVAVGDLDDDGDDEVAITRLVGVEVTVELLDLDASSGRLETSATFSLDNARAVAVTVGAPAGEAAEIDVLVSEPGSFPSGVEEMIVYRLGPATAPAIDLRFIARVDLGSGCETGSTPGDLGIVRSGADDAIAAMRQCNRPPGPLGAGMSDIQVYGVAGRGTAYNAQGSSIGTRAFLLSARVGPTPLSPRQAIVATTIEDEVDGVPTPRVAFFVPAPAGSPGVTTVDLGTIEIGYTGSILTEVAAADTDADGIDEIFASAVTTQYVGSRVPDFMGAYPGHWDERGSITSILRPDGTSIRMLDSASTPGTRVRIALGDVDGDNTRMHYTGVAIPHLGPPAVSLLLAAPPTWLGRPGVSNVDGSTTSLGRSRSEGGSTETTMTASASVSLSGGVDIGIVSLSASVTANVEAAFSRSMETEETTEITATIGATEDAVQFVSSPFVSYGYVIDTDPDPARIGQPFTVDVPQDIPALSRFVTLEGFRELFPARADAVIPPALFAHTIGDPTTYMAPGECTQAALSTRFPGAIIRNVRATAALHNVGMTTSGSIGESFSLSETTGTSSSLTLGVEASVGVGVGGVEVEASVGLSGGYTVSSTVGTGVTYSAVVGNLATGVNADTDYDWGLCVFTFTVPGQGSYPVVTYVVR
jgi:hypothetical protein